MIQNLKELGVWDKIPNFQYLISNEDQKYPADEKTRELRECFSGITGSIALV